MKARTRSELRRRTYRPEDANVSRRILIRMVAAATIVMTVTALLVAIHSRPTIGRGDFDQLRAGMSRAEVETILHGPPRNDLAHPVLVWMPRAGGRAVSARFGPASPAVEFLVKEDRPRGLPPGRMASAADDFFPDARLQGGRQDVWASPTGLVAVLYDGEGRLADRYFSTVDARPPPTVLGWLASRPAAIRRSMGL